MTSNPSQVIVQSDDSQTVFFHGLSAYHRNFPEVRGEGSSPQAAAGRLAELLSLVLDNAPSDWRRDNVLQAIEDVLAFSRRGK